MMLTQERLQTRPRYYYPDDLNVYDWSVISASFDALLHKEVATAADLLSMLYQANELLACIEDEYLQMSIRTMQDNTDKDAENKANLLLQEVILPGREKSKAILERYYNHPLRSRLSEENYHQLNHYFITEYKDDNPQAYELNFRITSLVQQYRSLLSSLAVVIDGKTIPVTTLATELENPDRSYREAVWIAIHQELLAHQAEFDAVITPLVQTRTQLASLAGFRAYDDYTLASPNYGGKDAAFLAHTQKAVDNVIYPAVRKLLSRRRKALGIRSAVKPWDTLYNPDTAVLQPFTSTDELIQKTIAVLYNIRFEYGILLNKMYNSGTLYLDYNPHKIAGEYYTTSRSQEGGYILMNVRNQCRDVVMFIHEIGHILQINKIMDNPLCQFMQLPVSAREMASQTLVYLSTEFWDEYYPDKADKYSAIAALYRNDILQIAEASLLNNFERSLYNHPDWTAPERDKALRNIYSLHNYGIDWKGLEAYQAVSWMLKYSLIQFPLYDFFSSLSVLNSWQVLHNFRHDRLQTISHFQSFLQNSGTTLDIFPLLNIKEDYSEAQMRRMLDYVAAELKHIKQ